MSGRIRYAVIPIAGYGTRMFPATKAVPKALLPIVHRGQVKPVLQVIIEEALSAGIERICIVCSPSQVSEVKNYFESAPLDIYVRKFPDICARIADIGSRIDYAIQHEMKGFGDAVLCAKSVVGTKDPILVMLGDHVYTSSAANKVPCAKQLVDAWVAHGSSGSATSLDTCDIHHVHVNGLVVCEPLGGSAHSTNVLRITSGAEKPSAAWVQANLKPSGKGASGEDVYTCYFGMDLLSPLIFEELESMDERTHGELQLRDAMMRVAARERMLGVQMEGKRHDTGLPYEYAASIAAMAAEE